MAVTVAIEVGVVGSSLIMAVTVAITACQIGAVIVTANRAVTTPTT